MKNFYDLLTWRDATKNSFPERLFFYPPDEFSGDLKIYISFEEREAHLTQRSVHVGFADNAVPTQILENFLKLVAELWKHSLYKVDRLLRRRYLIIAAEDAFGHQ